MTITHLPSLGTTAMTVEIRPPPPPQTVDAPEVLPVTYQTPDEVVTIEVVSQLTGAAVREAMPRQASNQLVDHMGDHMGNLILKKSSGGSDCRH